MGTLPFVQDVSRAFAGNIARGQVEENLQRLVPALASLRDAYEKKTLAHLRLPERTEDLAAIKALAEKLRSATDVVFLGTGGSSLGGQTLAQLGGYNVPGVGDLRRMPKLHFLDNLDPLSLEEFLSELPLESARFVAISKSGGTGETLLQTIAAIGALEKAKLGVAKHLFGISEPLKPGGKNGLRALLGKYGCEVLDHDTGVGGRFIALTNVGLLPALLADVDILALRKGAGAVLAPILSNAKPEDIAPAVGAALNVSASEAGLPMSVLLAYGDRFERMTRWWMQLWGESLGKDGKGSTPLASIGPVDQHSQLQLWLAGPRDKFFTILSSDTKGRGPRLDPALAEICGEPGFGGHTVGDLVAAQARATGDTLAKHSLPLRTITVKELDAFALGALLMHFMLETILAASLFGVDPYDQPAVEEGKILAKKYLAGEG
ncbi:MAG: glucose-6-phosphate isomerase [Xanthobacteraceae bacterium]|nr:glucose-6-phosphate isomerase [Xanthobacteraceae bacterium]